jgi:SNF2 family DNA or RNA helicase
VEWLIGHTGGAFPWDMLVIDESSSFKSHDARRFKALKMVRPLIRRVVALTGTPAGNGLVDLWPQMYLLDMGERLGKTISFFRQHYLTPVSQSGYVVHKYRCSEVAEKAIYERIGDIVISMKAEDYITLPDRYETVVKVKLDDKSKAMYDEFEREMVLELFEQDAEITALTAAALRNKLLQFANGAVYEGYAPDFDGRMRNKWHVVHDHKLDALGEIIEANEGRNILVFYQFKHDLERIQKRFKAVLLRGRQEMLDWNSGKIPLLVAHAASAGHGLNLQAGGSHAVWFGLTDSYELFAQANARLHRQGQTQPCYIHKLLCPGTFDPEVDRNLQGKKDGQDRLMEATKAIFRKHIKQLQ